MVFPRPRDKITQSRVTPSFTLTPITFVCRTIYSEPRMLDFAIMAPRVLLSCVGMGLIKHDQSTGENCRQNSRIRPRRT